MWECSLQYSSHRELQGGLFSCTGCLWGFFFFIFATTSPPGLPQHMEAVTNLLNYAKMENYWEKQQKASFLLLLLLIFSSLAYELSTVITQMSWLKKNSSVCILILNGNSCTSLVFQIWRWMFLLSLWEVFCIPILLNILWSSFSRCCLRVLIRPNLSLQMAVSLDFLSLALFLKFTPAPSLSPLPPCPILPWSFFSLKIFA